MNFLLLALVVVGLTSAYFNYLFLKWLIDVDPQIPMDSIVSQSEKYEMQKDHDKSFRETEEEKFVKIAIHDGNAYWINENGLQWAPIDEDDEVQYSLQQQVDAHSMSQQQINLMLEILDALKEDRYEGGSSGK